MHRGMQAAAHRRAAHGGQSSRRGRYKPPCSTQLRACKPKPALAPSQLLKGLAAGTLSDLLSYLLCPITQEPMHDPMKAAGEEAPRENNW
jgi:hypothetical protein